MWARNPLPYSNGQSPPQFAPPCDEKIDRKKSDTGLCSGRDPYNTLIGDEVVVPVVAPGKYVLGIRWDCEKSAQVWTNCADIEISAETPESSPCSCSCWPVKMCSCC